MNLSVTIAKLLLINFFTKCFIPSLQEEISVNKIQFGDYIQLNSYIKSEDKENTHLTLEKICEKSLKNIENYTNLDKFVLLIHLHLNYLGNILKLSAKDEDSEKITYEVFLKNIIKLLLFTFLSNKTTITYYFMFIHSHYTCNFVE